MINFLKGFFTKIFSMTNRFNLVCYGLIALGVIVRAKHYMTNCSLWTDEAWVAVSVSSRSFWQILQGVDIFPDLPKPPLGFLLLAKGAIMTLGDHEYALRLFSFISGAGALFVFDRLVRVFKDKALTVITLGFFALCPSLIYFSAELKQYSLDLLCGLVLYLVFSDTLGFKLGMRKVILLGFLGCWAMWMSNAAVFILAAFGITFSLFALWEKRWSCFLRSLLIYGCWMASFWFLYKNFLSNMASNTTLFQTWPGAMLEVSLFSKEAIVWMKNIFLAMFSDPLSFSFPVMAFVLFWIGFFSFVRLKKQGIAFLFLSTILITFLAAMVQKYPFRGRLLLFLFPGVLLLVVQGVLAIARGSRKEFSLGFMILFCLLLFAGPLTQTLRGFLKDYCREDNREAMSFIREHVRRGDFVLLNSAAQFPFWYYGGQRGLAQFFEETWAGMEQGVARKGVKIAKFWEGLKVSQGKQFTFFRYEYNLYDKDYHYVKSLIRSDLTEKDIYFLFEDLPFAYPVEGERLWLVLGNPSPDFERIATGSLGLRFPKLMECKRKGVSVYLYQTR